MSTYLHNLKKLVFLTCHCQDPGPNPVPLLCQAVALCIEPPSAHTEQ